MKHPSQRLARFALALVGTVAVALASAGRSADASGLITPRRWYMEWMVRHLRTQIEHYNIAHPDDRYGSDTPLVGFWDDLVEEGYLPEPPRNPLQHGSTVVAYASGVGVGWVWRQETGGNQYLIHGVDARGAELHTGW